MHGYPSILFVDAGKQIRNRIFFENQNPMQTKDRILSATPIEDGILSDHALSFQNIGTIFTAVMTISPASIFHPSRFSKYNQSPPKRIHPDVKCFARKRLG